MWTSGVPTASCQHPSVLVFFPGEAGAWHCLACGAEPQDVPSLALHLPGLTPPSFLLLAWLLAPAGQGRLLPIRAAWAGPQDLCSSFLLPSPGCVLGSLACVAVSFIIKTQLNRYAAAREQGQALHVPCSSSGPAAAKYEVGPQDSTDAGAFLPAGPCVLLCHL